jgi:hypothetical protein
MSRTKNDSIRLRILEILYKKAIEGGDWAVEREELKRLLPIPEHQFDFNVLYLHEKKLLKIHILENGNWQAAKISGKGIDVVENKPRFIGEFPFIQEAVREDKDDKTNESIETDQCEVNLYQEVSIAFEQAYEEVRKGDSLPEKKLEINANLKALENELRKQKPNKNKINAIYEWLKENANFVIPTVTESVTKLLNSA